MKPILGIALCFISVVASTKSWATVTLNQPGKTVIEAEDFVSATLIDSGDRPVVKAILTEAGATKIKQYSIEHQGEKLAVVLDGVQIADPIIRAPIEGRSFQIDALNSAQAKEVVRSINRH